MNELKTNNDFDYSSLDKRTAENLREKEYALVGIHARYSNEVGKVLYEAREDLAKHYKGTFEKWYTGLGFKTTNVYSYINAYKYTLELESSSKFEELEIFKRQPKSLQNEMSKPSAIPEVNQKVFEGDITAHKDYKEIEMYYQQQLKQKEEENQHLKQSYNEQAQEVQRLKNKPAEVVEKPVIPEDYEDLKRTTDFLTKRNEHLEKEHQDLLNQRKEVNEKSQKYDELTKAIQQSQGELNRVQQKIADYDGLHKVLKEGNALLAKLSVLVYSDLSDAVANDTLVKNELDILLSRFLKLNEDITKKITNNMIIEGEIIND